MNLSRAFAYALQALVYLARQDGDALVPSHAVASAISGPQQFLLRILGPLVSVGVLHARKGRRGGYRLARPAETITLLEIVEAVDGTLRAEAPQASEDAAFDRRLQAVCEDVAQLVRPVLERVTLADLAEEKSAGKKGARQKRGDA